MIALRRGLVALAALAVASVLCWRGLLWLDRTYPPPLGVVRATSSEVVDRDGRLLRAFATPTGRWRLRVHLDDVDPQFVRMLVAYEDHRFWTHHGVDPLAILRAAGQLVLNGHIVSGGSTLTMQLARLIEPRPDRTVVAKLLQMARALQIERRLTKRQILEDYLTLAPYGGNLEGVRAASLAYFGKEPKRLTLSQAALLVALPQSPETRRPDRAPKAARIARDRVLARMADAGVIARSEVQRAAANAVPRRRLALPALAPHLARAAIGDRTTGVERKVTLDRNVQAGLERVARDAAQRLGPRVSVAMIMADYKTGEILAEVGSSDFLNAARFGSVDMTSAPRSPGSTLKPFIYGLAFEDGLVMPETLIEDRPVSYAGYRPHNFDMTYQGDVTVRRALQMSLNVPAVRLLDSVGPTRLVARFRRAGVSPKLPPDEVAGLAIGLGGIGVTLRDLVQLYASLANGGQAMGLGDGVTGRAGPIAGAPFLSPVAAWHVADILHGVAPPQGAPKLPIAYKTGTSYGYRDAWSIGFDGAHVLGVWVGRADNGSVPGITGWTAAAPILFDGFVKSGLAIEPRAPAPPGAVRIAASDLPPALRRFASSPDDLVPSGPSDPAPQIVYPPAGVAVDLGLKGSDPVPLVLKLQGGRAPFRWLANGRPLPHLSRRRTSTWMPDGSGYSTLTVIDAAGRAASVKVFVE